jgi:hypothetical protein
MSVYAVVLRKPSRPVLDRTTSEHVSLWTPKTVTGS